VGVHRDVLRKFVREQEALFSEVSALEVAAHHRQPELLALQVRWLLHADSVVVRQRYVQRVWMVVVRDSDNVARLACLTPPIPVEQLAVMVQPGGLPGEKHVDCLLSVSKDASDRDRKVAQTAKQEVS